MKASPRPTASRAVIGGGDASPVRARLSELESTMLVAATGDIVYEHDYEQNRITWGGTYRQLLGYSDQEMGGGGESWLGRVHPADLPAVQGELAAAIAGRRAAELEYRFRARDGSYRWFHDRGVLAFDGAGRLIRVVGVMRDVTARRLTERELDSFFDLSLDLLCVATTNGRFTRVNPAFSRVLGYTPAHLTSRPYLEFVHPEDRGLTAVQAGRLQSGLPVMKFDNRYLCADGSVRWLSWNAVFNPDDGLVYAVARDMTEQKEVERHERLMSRELDHRVKNTLAGVLAAIEQTRTSADSVESLSASLAGRVRAMATAHDLLARSRWKGASLRDSATGITAPFAADGRIEIEGPDVVLSARAAPAVCMTLHELVTNAAKHGALSVPGGRVRVTWSVEPQGRQRRLRLLWQERGGPPARAPERRGYGTVFIENSVPYEVGGSVSLSFAPSGVQCEILCPLGLEPSPPAGAAP